MASSLTFRPHAPVSYRGEVTYDVLRGDELLGRVQRVVTESWRKSGRIRTSMNGYQRSWRPFVPAGEWGSGGRVVERWNGKLALEHSRTGLHTRKAAVALLLAWHDEPARRQTD